MMKIEIDVPGENAQIKANELTVEGWAIASKEIQSIVVLLNGIEVAAARWGFERTDVGAAFPDVKNSSYSGFKAVVDLYPVEDIKRQNELTVQMVCIDKETANKTRQFIYELL